jgi:hypothetical protein
MKLNIKENKTLSKDEKSVINNSRVNEWGEGERKDFLRDYEPETKWFFLKNPGVVALGGLRPIKISYLNKDYDLLGICSIISLVKDRGYGKMLIKEMINYANGEGKSMLGFTGKTEFFKKTGLDTEKDFIKRFIYKNPKTGEEIVDDDGDGIYLNGKDNFIKKVLSSRLKVYISILHW